MNPENKVGHPSIEASKNIRGINMENYLTCGDGVAQICATPSNTLNWLNSVRLVVYFLKTS